MNEMKALCVDLARSTGMTDDILIQSTADRLQMELWDRIFVQLMLSVPKSSQQTFTDKFGDLDAHSESGDIFDFFQQHIVNFDEKMQSIIDEFSQEYLMKVRKS